ncbi:MAG TPA: hypothetical protein DHV15_10650 [Treponema sp.]|uniref:Uncharacterized protein n=1 Tax=Treponema denticola (strain ATCC 35405 / DSM 14222 / CIP 103919 / JCM 8153 / KCTC 15104) TaxID=243275 RepID=Q73LK1_TREDE|nr:hypothetical protein TDE_1861 [Treponema denticola ATCC 35405]HCY95945.1 hypothetical protein [Treponema sp.]
MCEPFIGYLNNLIIASIIKAGIPRTIAPANKTGISQKTSLNARTKIPPTIPKTAAIIPKTKTIIKKAINIFPSIN